MLEELGRILAAAGLAHAHRDEPGTAGLGTRQIKATTTVTVTLMMGLRYPYLATVASLDLVRLSKRHTVRFRRT